MNPPFKKRLNLFLAVKIGWLAIIIMGKLMRIKTINRHYLEELERGGRSYILTMWHGRIFLPFYYFRRKGVTAMVSKHMDGEMIASTARKLGYRTVRGSSTRGGKKALNELSKILELKNKVAAITPDGPTGPARKVKPGVVLAASQSQAAILPLTFASSRAITLKSWDSFKIALPLSKNYIIFGKPIHVKSELAKEEIPSVIARVEKRLNDLEEYANGILL
ncbi:MAG: lysophospholipid acyltransferase family protein [Fidelibacterota bacterium]